MADQLQDQTVDHAAVCRFDGSVSGIARPPGDATGRSVSSVCDQLRGDSGSHLLGNAVKFTERGVVRVRVLHLTGDKDVLQIRCEIEDTGTGIPPEIPGGDCREWHGSRGGVGEQGGLALILMDCQMPVLDGYAATEQIRARERADDRVPIIALTAHAMKDADADCGAAGMDDYLTKPLDGSALVAVLARCGRARDATNQHRFAVGSAELGGRDVGVLAGDRS